MLQLTVTFTPAVSELIDLDRLEHAVVQALGTVVPEVPAPDEEWFMVTTWLSGDELDEARQLFEP